MKYFFIIYCFQIFYNICAADLTEDLINLDSPLSVLSPSKYLETERVTQNIRFFGEQSGRPTQNVYVHYQAIQNTRVFPNSPLTALAWMLFPVSPFPTLNPNNIGVSDPLGKLTPQKLGYLLKVLASNTPVQKRELYEVFGKDKEFSNSHNKSELKKFYRYALVDGLSKYALNGDIDEMTEYCQLNDEQKQELKVNPHLWVIKLLENSVDSYLLELPGTEALRQRGEMFFTKSELREICEEIPLPVNKRKTYTLFSDQGRARFRIRATVDMLKQSMKHSSQKTLQMLAYYAWRKFPQHIDIVMLESGVLAPNNQNSMSLPFRSPYTKADYRTLVAKMQVADNVDNFIKSLDEGKRNLLLYGGARYAQVSLQEYGNACVTNAVGRSLTFANCAEMSLFNCLLLAQLVEREMDWERGASLFTQGTFLHDFWRELKEEDLNTKETRDRWTQRLALLKNVIYRKGGKKKLPGALEDKNSHWAELNPGILNQLRALFDILGDSNYAETLQYANSSEATVQSALDRLTVFLNKVDPTFSITLGDKLENKIPQKEWYGNLHLLKRGKKLATWNFERDHSYLKLESLDVSPFALDTPSRNPYVLGQMVDVKYHHEDQGQTYGQLCTQLDQLVPSDWESFFDHACLMNEHYRYALGQYILKTNNMVLVPILERLLWGMVNIEEGELCRFLGSDDNLKSTIWKHQKMQRFTIFENKIAQQSRRASLAALSYCDTISPSQINYLKSNNKCSRLSLTASSDKNHIEATEFPYSLYINLAIQLLSHQQLPSLRLVNIGFFKDCQLDDIGTFAKLIPAHVKKIYIGYAPILPEHLQTLIKNIANSEMKYELSIDFWYEICKGNQSSFRTDHFMSLPDDKEEYIFNLLRPLAQKGLPFMPPQVICDVNIDLEPIYERLKSQLKEI